MIRVAVLTVSDTASTDRSYDKSYNHILSALSRVPGFECRQHFTVPDEKPRIQDMVLKICSQKVVDWLITTGGTGFAPRDVTPEALTPLIDKFAPGLVHLIITRSLAHTPLAALSRPIAGTIEDTLVITLPGSPKAVVENLDALLQDGIIRHAIELIKGGTGAQVHSALAAEGPQRHASHASHHSVTSSQMENPRSPTRSRAGPPSPDTSILISPKLKGTSLSQDPSQPVYARLRSSPFPIISPGEALQLVLALVTPLPTVFLPVTPDLAGYVLAEDVFASKNIPHTYTTSVDGYALRSSDPPGIYPVLTPSTHHPSLPLPIATLYRVNTGQALPPEADAVIMVEDTRLITISSTVPQEETQVQTMAKVAKGENVRDPGSDVRLGEVVAKKGDVVSAKGGEIGTLVFLGKKEAEVYKKPIAAIMSTGDEVVDIQSTSPAYDGTIWDTNRPSLTAALQGMGYEVLDLGIVPDVLQSHISTLSLALQKADIIIATGGTSMGATDLLKPVIEQHLNGRIHFGRISAKPGKPTTFASVPVRQGTKSKGKGREGERERDVPVFALPGNPASALVMFYIFVAPALRRLGGWPAESCTLPKVKVELNHTMHADTRTEYHRVRICAGPHGLIAHSTGGQRSSRMTSLKGANGFVVVPPKVEGGRNVLLKGEWADAILIGEIQA